MKRELEQAIASAVQDLFGESIKLELTRPDEKFGDYATNVALQIAARLQKNPREVAEQLAEHLRQILADQTREISVAGPGFINLTLNDHTLIQALKTEPQKNLSGRVVVAEYSDPNPFKILHAGHLYTSVVGDSVANLLEVAGAVVHRVNFGGDVGLHVAKNMYAILKFLGGENPEKLSQINEDDRADWLSERYIEGNEVYEKDEAAKQAIVELNKRIYKLHDDNDHDSPLAQIYWTGREWSYDSFNAFYAQIGSRFEKFYPESQTAPVGLATVRDHIGDVYLESDGAVIFDGEKYGLHTRVFINSEGLPTYEAKDVGLIMLKWQDYHFDRSVVITGNDIVEYMKVVLKSVEQFKPELAERTTHLTHGIVKLAGGVKMSSRLGNILRATDVIQSAAKANQEAYGQEDEKVTIGAIKYAFLKQRVGGDIVYAPAESVSLEGNSGPYLQYAFVRAQSILRKAQTEEYDISEQNLEPGERTLVRKLTEYAEAVDKAVAEYMPSSVCTYLYELAQAFNRFYEHNRVLGDPRESIRLQLVNKYAETLGKGLTLLGIDSPEKM